MSHSPVSFATRLPPSPNFFAHCPRSVCLLDYVSVCVWLPLHAAPCRCLTTMRWRWWLVESPTLSACSTLQVGVCVSLLARQSPHATCVGFCSFTDLFISEVQMICRIRRMFKSACPVMCSVFILGLRELFHLQWMPFHLACPTEGDDIVFAHPLSCLYAFLLCGWLLSDCREEVNCKMDYLLEWQSRCTRSLAHTPVLRVHHNVMPQF